MTDSAGFAPHSIVAQRWHDLTAAAFTDTQSFVQIFAHNSEVPFTFAHAAAAAPFRRTHLVVPAVIVGTMAPDFEYFMLLAPKSGYGHGWPGLLILTLPLALLVYWLYQAFVRAPLIWLLPEGFRQRVPYRSVEPNPFRLARFAIVLASLTAGIATHILWDSFTHPTTWVYRHWGLLSRTLTVPVLGTIQYYKAFQHSSTILGLAVLAVWIAYWYRTTPPTGLVAMTRSAQPRSAQRERLLVLAVIPGLALCGALIRAFLGVGKLTSVAVVEHFVAEWIITLIALLWWQLVIYGILRRRRFTA